MLSEIVHSGHPSYRSPQRGRVACVTRACHVSAYYVYLQPKYGWKRLVASVQCEVPSIRRHMETFGSVSYAGWRKSCYKPQGAVVERRSDDLLSRESSVVEMSMQNFNMIWSQSPLHNRRAGASLVARRMMKCYPLTSQMR